MKRLKQIWSRFALIDFGPPQVCLDLVRLLHFLSHSPLGSVALLDFQPRQFVLVSGTLKLTDLDDISAEPTKCQTLADCTLIFPQRNFTVPCVRGACEGLNQKRNMYNAYRYGGFTGMLGGFIQGQDAHMGRRKMKFNSFKL